MTARVKQTMARKRDGQKKLGALPTKAENSKTKKERVEVTPVATPECPKKEEGAPQRRFKARTRGLRAIKHYQKQTSGNIASKTKFQRICRMCVRIHGGSNTRISKGAFATLMQASESHLVGLLRRAMSCAAFCKRTTLGGGDLVFAKQMLQPLEMCEAMVKDEIY